MKKIGKLQILIAIIFLFAGIAGGGEKDPKPEPKAPELKPGKAYLGIRPGALSPEDQEKIMDLGYKQGSRIEEVLECSPAASAKFEVGDIILTFNGSKNTAHVDMVRNMMLVKSDDKVKILLLKKGQAKPEEVEVQLMGYNQYLREFERESEKSLKGKPSPELLKNLEWVNVEKGAEAPSLKKLEGKVVVLYFFQPYFDRDYGSEFTRDFIKGIRENGKLKNVEVLGICSLNSHAPKWAELVKPKMLEEIKEDKLDFPIAFEPWDKDNLNVSIHEQLKEFKLRQSPAFVILDDKGQVLTLRNLHFERERFFVEAPQDPKKPEGPKHLVPVTDWTEEVKLYREATLNYLNEVIEKASGKAKPGPRK